jgi:hypothetical protein
MKQDQHGADQQSTLQSSLPQYLLPYSIHVRVRFEAEVLAEAA